MSRAPGRGLPGAAAAAAALHARCLLTGRSLAVGLLPAMPNPAPCHSCLAAAAKERAALKGEAEYAKEREAAVAEAVAAAKEEAAAAQVRAVCCIACWLLSNRLVRYLCCSDVAQHTVALRGHPPPVSISVGGQKATVAATQRAPLRTPPPPPCLRSPAPHAAAHCYACCVQEKAVAAAVAEAVAKAREAAEQAQAEAVAGAAAEARAAAVEETTSLLLDLIYLGSVSIGRCFSCWLLQAFAAPAVPAESAAYALCASVIVQRAEWLQAVPGCPQQLQCRVLCSAAVLLGRPPCCLVQCRGKERLVSALPSSGCVPAQLHHPPHLLAATPCRHHTCVPLLYCCSRTLCSCRCPAAEL